ncbi:MAG: photosynthetic reaction center cytochrome c subunit [Cyclobacteriaceae bacterium]|nr:photosynthetic reaction center cytochrome c subunit [Cyclobacteriaceae bacterium]
MRNLKFLTPVLFLLVLFTSLSSMQSPTAKGEVQKDSLAADRAMHIARVKDVITGKENMPADSVFSNIKIFKGVPAGRILAIMDIGYSQSLGVSCGHCHDTNDFASEIKPEKQITREMWAFAAKTRSMLKDIKGLKSETPMVNCTTCHRGQVKPALSLN